MLINKVSEEGSGDGKAGNSGEGEEAEYNTANELFELMTKNAHFEYDNDSLSAQDLILLYQNLDIGTRLMNDASELVIKKPNQFVETIVYNEQEDHGSDSDSEIYSNAEIHDVFTVNQERLDFLNNSSLDNLLCHKFGGLAMHTSELSFDYDKNFLFQDPYIKNQVQNLNVIGSASTFDNMFSTSLIDYICCKRLEDNYNFYMDNIIRYVKHTIEQLKRISNGDYLTDRAKEKWREVNSCNIKQENDTKVLASSATIPLHVECKKTGNATWDDLVHSEVDVRSLSKILEKKIIVEIPKLICGSYRLYSQRYADNLIISCQREQERIERSGQESRVDVVLKLQRSQTGQVMSNISSIMILKTTPALSDIRAKVILPPPTKDETEYRATTVTNTKESLLTVIELIKKPESPIAEHEVGSTIIEEILEGDGAGNGGSCLEANNYPFGEQHASYASIIYSSDTSLGTKNSLEKDTFSVNEEEKVYNIISYHDLKMTMRKLNLQNSALEESDEDTVSQSTSKRRSPIRSRIKSPYENKSMALEEKKRKRLLEIRDRREKKKMALSESCKISKHRYGRGAVMAQASSSVTKLSITNKSFYNSIYGHNLTPEIKQKHRKSPKLTPDPSPSLDETCESFKSPMSSPERNSKKYINRNYILEDAESEMMYLQRKKSERKEVVSPYSVTDSVISNEFNEKLDILKELITPSETNFTNDTCHTDDSFLSYPEAPCSGGKSLLPIAETKNMISTATDSPTKKTSSGDACRRSIDQLYDLIKQFKNPNSNTEIEQNKIVTITDGVVGDSSAIHANKSTTNVENQRRGTHDTERNSSATSRSKSSKIQPPTAVPNVIISSKQAPKTEAEKMKRDRNKRVVVSTPYKGPLAENPLTAISNLLHEFDNIQKNRQKPASDAKPHKKVEIVNDVKPHTRQAAGSYRRKSRFEQHFKGNELEKKSPPEHTSSRDRRVRPMTPSEIARALHQRSHADDRYFDKIPKKKIADIIDEAREARGEAVRGPSKFTSRLNSLAQPKKSYVQAHHEEYQHRYGRNMVLAERLQKLATTPAPPPAVERNVTSPTLKNYNRWRRNGADVASASVKQRAPSVPHLGTEQYRAPGGRKRRSASSSPDSPTRHSPARPKHAPGETSESFSKKMSEVESYVHHSRATRGEERQAGMRCRVPLVPRDFDIVSVASSSEVEEASSLGDSLRRMIDCVLSPGLTAVAECDELPPPRTPSDFCVDILEDCYITTAVSAVRADSLRSLHQQHNSAAELEKLESALYSRMPGAFQKRLRIKNLTLTPKTSLQQVFLLQSGDAASVLVKSVSNMKMKASVESLHELKAMPVLSNSHLDWTFAQIPVQISTLGYALTQNKPPSTTNSRVQWTEPMEVYNERRPTALTVNKMEGTDDIDVNEAAAVMESVGDSIKPPVDNKLEGIGNSDGDVLKATETEKLHCHCTLGGWNSKEKNMLTCINSNNVKENENKEYLPAAVTPFQQLSAQYSKPQLAPPGPQPVRSESPPASCSEPMSTTSPDPVGYTTSLDMLVGLLNEIQKITCQNQMAATDHQSSELDTLHNSAGGGVRQTNTSHELISITSLDNLRQLESSTSVFTFNVSNYDATSIDNVEPVFDLKGKVSGFTNVNARLHVPVKEHVAVEVTKPVGVDKEVEVNMCEGYSDTCTNVPSGVATVALNCTADVSTTALAIFSEPSSHSILTCIDYSVPSSTVFPTPAIKIIELPQIETNEKRAILLRHSTDLKQQTYSSFALIRKIENVKKEGSLIARKEFSRYCVENMDLDPMFKIKRSILVSMYSILVLTVFAALSFPEILVLQP